MFWLWVLLAIIIAAAVGYITYRADVKRAVPHPWLTATLRGVVILLTVLLLLAPVFTISKNETLKPIVLFVQDNSSSIADALGKDSTRYKTATEELLQQLSEDYRVVTWGLDGNKPQDSLHNYTYEYTDISTTINKVQEYYGTQNLGAVILASDGKYNQGVNPLYQNKALKSSLYTIGIGDTTLQRDIKIARTYANKTVSMNNSFEIRADVVATKAKGNNTSVQLTENGNVLATVPVNINSDKYDRSIAFTVKASKAGVHHYTISTGSIDGETNTINNKRDVFVEVVDEQKHILIAGAAPHPDIKAIKEALKGLDNYKITVRVNNDFPSFTDEYDILILHNLPAQGFAKNPTIQRANKPIWYFTGSKTDNNVIATMQKPVAVNTTTYTGKNSFAVYNNTFNAFTLPQNINEVVGRMPPVFVPAGMLKAYPNTQVLFHSKTGDIPIWAVAQGKQPTAMFTGDGLWRWRMHEYKNFGNSDLIDECIRQTISFLSAADGAQSFNVTLPKYVWNDQESISLNAYVRNANNELINDPEVNINITDSSGEKAAYTFERKGSSYQLNIGVRSGGSYTYTASVALNGKRQTTTGSFVVESIPLELMETGADYNMLYGLATKNNGAFFTIDNIGSLKDSIANNQNITPVIETNLETVPLIDRKWFFFLILLFAVAEWLLRKYWLAQ